MSQSEEWSRVSHEGASILVRRPRLGPLDLLVQLWRAIPLMLIVFLPIFAAGLFVALNMGETYESRARLLVTLGDEYVYRPDVGSDAAGATPESEELIQAELELIRSPVVAERTLTRFRIEQLYPDLAEGCAEKRAQLSQPQQINALEYECFQKAVTSIQKSFGASAAPRTPVILTTFEHENRETSAEVLNALIGSYLKYRSEIFADDSSGSLGAQRERFEQDLLAAENDIKGFLVSEGIGSFESELETVRQLYQTASAELFANQSRTRVVQGQLSTYRSQLVNLQPEQNLFVEDTTDQTLLNLRLEREDKLTRYREDSRVIAEIDRRIAQTEQYLAEQDGPVGTVRRGPNPVYTEIETAVNNLEAEQAALTAQQRELRRQITAFEDRQRRLTELSPRHQELVRRRDLLEANVRNFSEREVEARARNEIFQQRVDNIRVLEPARAPLEGSGLKGPVAILAFLFAAFSALIAGLLRAMTREGFTTAKSVERTSGLPVLSSIPRR